MFDGDRFFGTPVAGPKIVAKFGGAAFKDAKTLACVMDIVQKYLFDGIVVSAPCGVTNALEELHRCSPTRARELLECIRSIFLGHAQTLGVSIETELNATLDRVMRIAHDKNVFDEMRSRGDDLMGLLTARWLEPYGYIRLDASKAMRVNPDGKLDYLTSDRQARTLIRGRRFVMDGFSGGTAYNKIKVIEGRNSSDLSATAIASIINADECWMYKDVPGVLTGPPAYIERPQSIPRMTESEIVALCLRGSRVMHAKALQPVKPIGMRKGTRVTIKSFLQPDHPGTKIYYDNEELPETTNAGTPTAISFTDGLIPIGFERDGMDDDIGDLAWFSSRVARAGIRVELPQGEPNVLEFLCDKDKLAGDAGADFEKHLKEISDTRDEYRIKPDAVWRGEPVAVVYIVGRAIKGVPGVAAQVMCALWREGINLIAPNQSWRKESLSLTIAANDLARTLNVVHDTFWPHTMRHKFSRRVLQLARRAALL